MKRPHKILAIITLAASASATTGCGTQAPISAPASISQESNDVQLLQMWRDKSIQFEPGYCDGPTPAEGETVIKDCRRQAKDFVKASWTDVDSPAINTWNFPTYRHQNIISSRFSGGHLVEVRILVKKSALEAASFTGIGFYFSNVQNEEVRTIAKEDLHVVNTEPVFLRATGEEASVLRFVAYMPGIAGNSATGWAMNSFALKPFAQFSVGADTYQNWEGVQNNFKVYRYPNGGGRNQNTSIDRQSELLR